MKIFIRWTLFIASILLLCAFLLALYSVNQNNIEPETTINTQSLLPKTQIIPISDWDSKSSVRVVEIQVDGKKFGYCIEHKYYSGIGQYDCNVMENFNGR